MGHGHRRAHLRRAICYLRADIIIVIVEIDVGKASIARISQQHGM
jgi:hypothetical protein